MTVSEIKQTLENVRLTERAYKSALAVATAYEQQLTGGRCMRYDRQGYPGTKGNHTEDGLVRLADYRAEADRKFDELVAARKNAERLIASVSDPVGREVLTLRYIFGKRWEDIAGEMNYSRRHIFRFHDKALSEISKKMTHDVTKCHLTLHS